MHVRVYDFSKLFLHLHDSCQNQSVFMFETLIRGFLKNLRSELNFRGFCTPGGILPPSNMKTKNCRKQLILIHKISVSWLCKEELMILSTDRGSSLNVC